MENRTDESSRGVEEEDDVHQHEGFLEWLGLESSIESYFRKVRKESLDA